MNSVIGDWLFGLFGSNGELGLIIFIFLIFLLDALLVPTLPELFFVLAFMGCPPYRAPLVFGSEILLAAVAAELVGILSLYYIAKHIRIPGRVERAVQKYTKFLVMGDERLLLLNRVAPMIPFAGAFIAIAKWNLKKSLSYVVLGCVLKYGAILLMSDFFFQYFSSSEAQTITIVFIFTVIIVSFIASYIMQKRKGVGKNADKGPKP